MSKKIGVFPWVDFAFRKIFAKPGNEECLIGLLNAILGLPTPVERVQYLNPFSVQEYFDDKQVCVDVKATDSTGRVFVVEIQLVIHESFAKRAAFYACSAYTDQLEKGNPYEQLNATYCVCLLMRKLWDDPQVHHHFRFAEKSTGQLLKDSIEIHTVELSKYNNKSLDNATSFEQWCYWMKNADKHSAEELRRLLPDTAFWRATEELSEIKQITEEKEMYDSREKAIRDQESHLIESLSKGRKQGLRKGLKRGLEKGLKQGREEGREEGARIGIEVGFIQSLQEILGIEVQSQQELTQKSLPELIALKESLQAVVRDKNR
jgi:predicted transposase/invertase (TIGR01784 family)